ncbi:Bug family tripartite tricarboxylate transporter substrate binding protein [Pseudomonas matsuisoli]|uniref:Tripartite-type tricarboxylate transporter, receptor component TctC n=1 Tax=Pseudomonas matsuisoli TaxID=1515666 RepID=A0A917PP61_9PSED|nr:tripartite tricarboxylate transporter substrate binding protein [Pseudomonas matsuisoli]GGJ85634.1 hypothetical protein GCM10009304_09650 [Pseudomonas matsuisoli]
MKTKIRINLMAGLLASSLFAISASASDYPARDIDFVVGYSAGGSTDVLARMVAPYLQQQLGDASIAVLNRPGGAGEVSYTEIARARPDGYTIGMVNMPGVINPIIERTPAYSLDNFTYLGNLVFDPTAVFVKSSSEFKTLKDWVEYAKANPGKLTVSNPGLGGAQHTSFERFLMKADIKLNNIPFNGGARSRAALLGGHVSASVMGFSEAADLVASGDVRVLGIMSDKRIEGSADAPTFQEQGYDIIGGSYRGLVAPAGLESDVVDKLQAAVKAVAEDETFAADARKRMYLLTYQSPEQMARQAKLLQTEMTELWSSHPWVKK